MKLKTFGRGRGGVDGRWSMGSLHPDVEILREAMERLVGLRGGRVDGQLLHARAAQGVT
ncbi:hypothetical protein WME94_33570 [Sorangium sp. So ce429]